MERPRRNNIFSSAARNPEMMIAVLAAFCLIWFSAPAVGLSPDSISYTSAARSLITTGRPYEFDGEWLVDFPLGYPVWLSLIMFITRIDPFQFGLALNAILFAILVLICLRETKRNGFPLLLRCGYALCLLFSTALLQVYGMLWSETLFILCIALFFAGAGLYGRGHSVKALWIMALATAVACCTRYIGVALAGVGFLLLATDNTLPKRKQALHLLLYSSVSISLLGINLVWNRLNNANMAGDRLINQVPFSQHLQRFGETLLRWLPLPAGLPATLFAAVFIAGSILASGYLLGRKKFLYSWSALGLLFTAIYSIFLLALATLTAFQPLDSRLLAPLWFPALGAGAGGLLLLKRRLAAGSRSMLPWFGVFALAALVLVVIPGLSREYRYIRHPEEVYQDLIRYDLNRYQNSPTLRFVQDHPRLFRSDKQLYSNAGELLYVLDTLPSAYLPQLNSAEEMQDFNGDTAYLVWLHTVHTYPGEYLPALKRASGLRPLYTFPDGIIYINH